MALVEMVYQRFVPTSTDGIEVRYRPCHVYQVPDKQAEEWAKENPPSCRIIHMEKPEPAREARTPLSTPVKKRRRKQRGTKPKVKDTASGGNS
jgi:hypothetical protein